MKILEISTLKESSRITREHKQLKKIFKKHLDINIEHTYIYDKKIIDILDKKGVIMNNIYNAYGKGKKYDWIHVRVSDADWKKLEFRKTLYGRSNLINGVVITYGRWHDRSRYRQANRFRRDLGYRPYEHILGMCHEFIHGMEGNFAIAHTFLYGYDRLYARIGESYNKPKRYVKEPSLIKALDWVINKSSFYKQIVSGIIKIKPIIIQSTKRLYQYFEKSEVIGLDHDFVLLLDKAREIGGIPFVINSGFRTKAHNKVVGGVPNSSHLKGLAVDLRARDGEEIYKIVNACTQVGIKRIGINWNKKFVHVDVDYSKPNPTIYQYKK